MSSEVGSGQVAIFPVFKGFRSAVSKETDSAAKSASTTFSRVFGRTGTKAGTSVGKSFKGGFESAAKGTGTSALRQLTADVAKSARAVSASRLKEQDAAGKLRVAEAQLTETRAKYTAGSARMVAAEERAASAQRAVAAAEDATKTASTSLTNAQQRLKAATENAGDGADRTRRRFGQLGSSGVRVFGTLSSSAGAVARVVGAGLGFGIGALAVAGFTRVVGRAVGVISTSITAASNLQQSIGGVEAVFGKSSKTINRWATGAAKSVGLSKNAYNQFAAVIGSQLKGAGVPMDALAKKTDQLIKLGSDLSATYGGTTAEAVDALGASLRGEFDPLERFGVSLNQAAINSKGVALGFDLVSGSLSTQGKQAATLALIYDRTKDAQGQFGKQTSTLAEQQQILAAQTENLKAKFGTALLPVVSSLVGVLSNAATVVLPKLQPLFDGIAARAGGLADKLNGVDIGGFIDKISAGAAALQSALGPVLQAVGPALIGSFASVAPVLGTALQTLAPTLATVIPQLALAATQILPSLVQVLLALAPILPPIAQVIAVLAPGIAAVVSAIAPLIGQQAGLLGFFAALGRGADVGKLAMDGLRGKFGPLVQTIGTFGAVVGIMIGNAIVDFRRIASTVAGVVSSVGGAIGRAVGFFNGLQAGIGIAVARGIGAFNRLPGAIGAAVGRAVAFVAGLPGRASAALGSLGGRLFSSGAALIDGFIGGIRSRIAAVANVASQAMSAAARFFPHSPALEGPFSGRGWTRYSGQATLDGYAQGMDDRVNRVRASSAAAMRAASFVSSAGVTSAVGGSSSGSASSRPIYMDGSLFGLLQETANGEATIVLNTQNASMNTAARMGPRRRRS